MRIPLRSGNARASSLCTLALAITAIGCKVSVGAIKKSDKPAPAGAPALIAPGQEGCPASRLAGGGCARSADGAALLNVEYLAPPRAGRPLVLVVNGGPGEDSTPYHRIPFFQSFLPTHDVAFYTQRATGTAPFTGRKETLNTSRNVDDLESVRAALGASHSAIIPVAHSYGGEIVASHLTRFPGAIGKVVLLNAVPSVKAAAYQLGFILSRIHDIAVAKYGPEKGLGVLMAANYGLLQDAQGRKTSGLALAAAYHAEPTYRTSTQVLPAMIDQLVAVNAPALAQVMALRLTLGTFGDKLLEEGSRPVTPAAAPPDTPVKRWIDCNSRGTPEALADFERTTDRGKDINKFLIGNGRVRYAQTCASLPLEGREYVTHKESLATWRAEILQVGSTHDLIYPKSLFEEVHGALGAAGVRASLVMVNAAGHIPFIERPECVMPHVQAFLQGAMAPGSRIDCP